MSGELRIGGVVLSCIDGFVDAPHRLHNGKARRRNRGSRQRKVQKSPSSSESDEVMNDYIQSCLSDKALSDPSDIEAQESLDLMQSLLTGDLEEGPRVEDIGIPGMYDDEESTAESESVSSDENSLHSCDEDLEDSDVGVKTTQAKLKAMYPVLMRDKVQNPGTPSHGKRGQKKTQPGTQTQNRKGKSKEKLPGKRELKRLKLEEKRGKRNSDRGFNVDRVNQQLYSLATSQTDLELIGFAPMSKEENKQILQMATLYGLSGSAKPAKGSKSFVTVKTTNRSGPPEGKARAKLTQLVNTVRGQQKSHTPKAGTQIERITAERPSLGGSSQKGRSKSGSFQQNTFDKFPSSGKKPVTFLPSGCLNEHEPTNIVIFRPDSSTKFSIQEEMGPSNITFPETRIENVYLEEGDRLDEKKTDFSSDLEGHLGLGHITPYGLGFVDPNSERQRQRQSTASPSKLGFSHIGNFENEDRGQEEAMTEVQEEKEEDSSGEAIIDVSEEFILQTGSFATDFGSLSVFEDRGQHVEDESAGESIQYKSLTNRPIPSIFTTKKQHKRAIKKMEKDQRRSAREELGMPSFMEIGHKTPALGHASFEAHTRGVGSKIMAQMGYLGEGTGLGRNKQGISEPLKAHQRPKKLGLGA